MPYTFGELRVGCSGVFRKTITDADINMFVAVSGDTNPLHIDDVFAKQTPFGQRIAHGMISASFISSAIASTLPGSIYMSQTLSFLAPVFIGDTIKTVVTCKSIGEKNRVTLLTECYNQRDELVTRGEALVKHPNERESSSNLETWQLEYADSAFSAEKSGQGLRPVSKVYPECSVAQAYQIQAFNVAKQKRAGRKLAGYKVGLTSPAGQKRFGIEQPIYGCLFEDMLWKNGAAIERSTLNSPQLETEIAFTLSRDIDSAIYSVKEAAAYVEKVSIAFEIVSGRLSEAPGRAMDLIADNALARGVVLGEGTENGDALERLADFQLTLYKNGTAAEESYGRDVLGNPLNALIWLANILLASGSYLKKGDVVMTGAANPALPVAPGEKYVAVCKELGEVAVQF